RHLRRDRQAPAPAPHRHRPAEVGLGSGRHPPPWEEASTHLGGPLSSIPPPLVGGGFRGRGLARGSGPKTSINPRTYTAFATSGRLERNRCGIDAIRLFCAPAGARPPPPDSPAHKRRGNLCERSQRCVDAKDAERRTRGCPACVAAVAG